MTTGDVVAVMCFLLKALFLVWLIGATLSWMSIWLDVFLWDPPSVTLGWIYCLDAEIEAWVGRADALFFLCIEYESGEKTSVLEVYLLL